LTINEKPLDGVRAQPGRVIQGKAEAIELVLLGLLVGGHVLVEDVPGVGKTTLSKALARAFAVRFSRVQFTPDLLPADIVGSRVLDPRQGTFTFHEGPPRSPARPGPLAPEPGVDRPLDRDRVPLPPVAQRLVTTQQRRRLAGLVGAILRQRILRGRVSRYPLALDPGLDPSVGVAFTHHVVPAESVVLGDAVAGDDAGGDADGASQQHEARGEVLAVAAAVAEEEVEDRVEVDVAANDAGVAEVTLQVALNGLDLLQVGGGAGGPAGREFVEAKTDTASQVSVEG
jgi:hypothetical protein